MFGYNCQIVTDGGAKVRGIYTAIARTSYKDSNGVVDGLRTANSEKIMGLDYSVSFFVKMPSMSPRLSI